MKSCVKRLLLPGVLLASVLMLACAPSDSDETDLGLGERDTSSGYESPNEFGDYPCTDDCSGHEAGYRWAEEHGIDDPNDCDGKSNSFIEGCITYAEEQSGEDMDADFEADSYGDDE